MTGDLDTTLRICIASDRMLPTIELDGQLCCRTSKIDDIYLPDRGLPAKPV